MCILVSLSACASPYSTHMPINHGGYIPDVNLKGDALTAYYADVAACQQQIIQKYGDKYISNNAIIDVRHCLINKGYVLLS
jgi:hypothetical protein